MRRIDPYWRAPLFVGAVMGAGMVLVGALGAIVTRTWVPLVGCGIAVTAAILVLAITFGLCAWADRLFPPSGKGD